MRNAEDVLRERGLRDAAASGDAAAWLALYEAAFERVAAYLRWRLGGGDAEDLTQETWLIAARGVRRFDPAAGSFADWVRGIAANAIRNYLRSRRRKPPPVTGADEQSVAQRESSAEEAAEIVARTLSALPERYEQVLRAKYLDGMSVCMIAKNTGETEKAVESLLSRARQAFREQYATENPP